MTALALVLPLAGVMTVLPASPAAAAEDSTISLEKGGPGNVLAGGQAEYTLTASNPADGPSPVPQYNLSFRDQLPPGVTYIPGSTSPSGAGEPTVTTIKPDPDDDTTWYQVLTWQNVADLQVGSTYEMTFSAAVDESLHPVGTTLANDADAFTNEDARYEPKFDANGNVVPNSYTASDSASVTNTQVTAFQIAKTSSDSPEGELMRGIHDHVSTYTLDVTNNPSFPTDEIVITDYLPAGLEFLGCGTVDNSTDTALYPDGLEYPDAPPLTATPAPAGCIVPESVETVTGPIIDNGQAIPAGVFTKVTWRLGDFEAEQVKRIVYQAGIPQRANTTDWQGSPAPPTTADDGQPPQTANLDNNTGPSTRESDELALRNIVVGTGQYTGAPGSPDDPLEVSSSTDHTVTAEDLAMQKSVSPGVFQAGAPATYTLALQTSEYVTADSITITDVMPNGVCPIWDTQSPEILPSPDSLPSECGVGKGTDPAGARLDRVTRNDDGTFTLLFTPTGQPWAANARPTVSYQGWMRSEYTSNSQPTAAGDSFTNRASVDGTTDIRDDIDVNAPDPDGSLVVHDESSATQTSVDPGIDKRIKPNTSGAEGYQCAAGTQETNPGGTTPDPTEYVDPPAPPLTDPEDVADFTFRNGSIVCFLLHVAFPTEAWTRNPVVTDFLPAGSTYVEGSMTTTPNSTAPFDPGQFTSQGTVLTWKPGQEQGGGTYVAVGKVFEVVFAARITEPASGATPDIVGNLMKFRSENSSGQSISLRDRLDFQVAPLPPVSLVKGIATITPAVGGDSQDWNDPDDPAANVDGKDVRAGDTVTFRVDVRNDSDKLPDPGVGSSVRSLDGMDLLQPGVDCLSIVAASVTTPGVCLDPGDTDYPDTLPGTQSVIRWTFDQSDANQILAGGTKTLTYDFVVPEDASVGEVFTDTAGVRSYQAWTNVNEQAATYYPEDNIDPGACGGDGKPECQAPAAKDPSNVRVVNVSLTKIGTTSITEDNNDAPNQATIGELATYTVTATVPYGSSVYRGVLTDALPFGMQLVEATADFSADGGDTWGAVPGGTTGPTASGQNVTLALPTSYTAAASSETDHVFRMTITARVTTDPSNAQDVRRTNTATFASRAADADDAPAIPAPIPATYDLTIVEPNPSLTKAASPSSGLVAGQTVTYTLKASNAAGRPPLHNGFVVDCVPAGIDFVDYGTPTDGPTVDAIPGDGNNGCAVGQTKLVWQPTSPSTPATADGTLLGGTTATLTYTATVSTTSAGLTAYTNTATLKGGTLYDASQTTPETAPNPDERTYTVQAATTVTVKGGTVVKTVTPASATVGETASWTITATLPANVNFYQASVIDQVERGIDMSTVTTEPVVCTPSCTVAGSSLAPATGPSNSTLIGWYLGDVAASTTVRTVTITYSAKVANIDATTPKRSDQLKDAATLKWDSVDKPDAPSSAAAVFERTSDPATASLTVLEPLVSIEKSVTDTTPDPGQSITYTIVVRNSSETNVSTAYNVDVRDLVPTGVVVQAGTISGSGTIAPTPIPAGGGGTITWPTIASIAPGGSVTFTYQARLAPSAGLTAAGKLNTAAVTGYNSLADDTGREYTGPEDRETVTPQFPQVTPSKTTPDGDIAYVGDPFTWRLTLTNTGASRAYGVDAVDTLPPNWRFTAVSSISVAGAAIPVVDPTVSTGNPQVLTWTDLGAIDPGQAIVVTFTATPQTGALTDPGVTASTGTRVPHTNTVATTAEDATGAQGSGAGPYNAGPATAPAYIHSADLVVDKSHTGAPVAGSTFAWTIKVTNNGPDVAVGPFTVSDTVEAPMTYAGATGTGWTCSATGSAVSCTRSNATDTLARGASFPDITLRVTIPSDQALPTTLRNTAAVTGKTHDPNPGNNTDTDTAALTARADLRIVKARTGPLVAGQDVTYTLDVSNLGPSTSRATISVSDPVPTGTTFVSARGSGWSCPADGASISTITCTRGTDLLAGQAAGQITIVLHVGSGFTGSLTNIATVTGPTPDPVPGNNTSTVTAPVTTLADVAIEKTHGGDFIPGTSDNTYTFTVTNFGPSDAAAPVRVTDELPAHLSWVGTKTDLSGTWACVAAPPDAPMAPDRQTVTCTLSSGLVVGQTRAVRLDIAVATTAPAAGEFVNTARVTSGTTDPNESNNSSTDRTEFDSLADLAISKTPATQIVVAGETVTWILTASNNGPSNSVGPTTVVDVLPEGTSFESATGAGWTCVQDPDRPRVITCTDPDGITAGGSLPTITVVADVAPSAGPATLVNNAIVDGPTPDPDPTNNHDSADVTVVDEADLGIVKTFTGDNPVPAGAKTTFSLAVENLGPSDADSLVVSDELPAGLTYVSATGTGWTCAAVGQIVTCTRPSLAADTPAPDITLTVNVDSGFSPATIVNTATISAATADNNPDNDSSSDGFQVIASADLVLDKSHAEDAVAVAGQEFIFALTVSNDGPSDALAPITVTDHLPAGLSYVGNGPGWACTTSGTPAVDEVVECTRDGDESLIAGTSALPLTITTLIAPDTDPGELENTATVTSPTPDPDEENNTDVDPIEVTTLANLVVTKSHTAAATVGGELAFTLGVSNDGPSEARTVTLVDTLPTGLTFVSAAGTGWSCTADGQVISCALSGPLPPKEAAPPVTLTVKVAPAAYPKAENVVVGSTSTPESSTQDNRATDPVTVPPLVDLAIDKSHQGPFTVGTNGTYTLTVRNNGPTSDPGPQTVVDTLPTGLGFISGAGEGWTCSASGAFVTCERKAPLAVDASTSVALVVSVGPAAAPSVVNTATVSTPSTETTTANNTDSDLTEVTPVSRLTIAKEAVDVDGDRVTYEITVANTGPNATSAPIVVSDPLPDGLDFVSVSGDGWQCTGGRTVTCTYAASLAVGASASFVLVTTMSADPGTEITNVATVISGGEGQVSDDEAVVSPDSDGGSGSDSGAGGLADTGANVVRTVTLAILLMLLGSLAVQRARRATRRV